MALPTAYVTVAEADLINFSTEWIALTEANKEIALSWGRIYIDANYDCTIDEDDPDDSAKHANAVFGDYYARGILYEAPDSRTEEKTTTREKVKAGSVEVEEEYAVTGGGAVMKDDPFINVSQLLNQIGCFYSGGNTNSCGVITRARAQ